MISNDLWVFAVGLAVGALGVGSCARLVVIVADSGDSTESA